MLSTRNTTRLACHVCNINIASFLLGANVIFNAARNALSFFMLLIVSLGYGVVKYIRLTIGLLSAQL